MRKCYVTDVKKMILFNILFFRSIFMHSVQHLTPVLNEFLLGLKSYDFSSQLLKKLDLLKHVFCPFPFFQWDLNLLVNHLHPCFAEDGGNKKGNCYVQGFRRHG